MLIVGLTGNYGMGKSFVLSVFRELGAETLESDRIVDYLLREKEVVDDICSLLGEDVRNDHGGLDKKKVAARIFGDAGLKARVEALIHPMVLRRIYDFIRGVSGKARIVVIEIPLLFECDYRDMYQKIITVFTPEETALRRLMDAGISRADATARIAAQLPIETKRRLADFTVDNGGTREETVNQVKATYRKLFEEEKRLGQ